jgi:hypothetical protein
VRENVRPRNDDVGVDGRKDNGEKQLLPRRLEIKMWVERVAKMEISRQVMMSSILL